LHCRSNLPLGQEQQIQLTEQRSPKRSRMLNCVHLQAFIQICVLQSDPRFLERPHPFRTRNGVPTTPSYSRVRNYQSDRVFECGNMETLYSRLRARRTFHDDERLEARQKGEARFVQFFDQWCKVALPSSIWWNCGSHGVSVHGKAATTHSS
jgi:hypothetical protein